MAKEPKCRKCGCTEGRACISEHGPCFWVEKDLCIACVEWRRPEPTNPPRRR